MFRSSMTSRALRRKRKRLSSNREKRKSVITPARIREAFSWLFITAIAVLFAYMTVAIMGYQVRVIGDSMEPTLAGGQRLLINRAIYHISSPKRGDIIAFLPNGNKNSYEYVKRVVAVSGDRVSIADGQLVLNGETISNTDTIFDDMEEAGLAANEIQLKAGEFFVLGDNRNSSEDSRNANIGLVTREMIAGKVWYAFNDGSGNGGFVRR